MWYSSLAMPWTGAGNASNRETLGHRGRAGDPLYSARRTLHTGVDLLTDKQKTRLDALFSDDQHAAVEVTWCVQQDLRNPDRAAGRQAIQKAINALSRGVPAPSSNSASSAPR